VRDYSGDLATFAKSRVYAGVGKKWRCSVRGAAVALEVACVRGEGGTPRRDVWLIRVAVRML